MSSMILVACRASTSVPTGLTDCMVDEVEWCARDLQEKVMRKLQFARSKPTTTHVFIFSMLIFPELRMTQGVMEASLVYALQDHKFKRVA